jgi:peroxiredoxin
MNRATLWLMGAILPAVLGAAPATRPSELSLMSRAYEKLTSLRLAGTIEFSADIDGQTARRQAAFTALFKSPMRFRHEISGDAIAAEGEASAAGEGPKVYLFLPALNGYVTADAPEQRGGLASLPHEVQGVLMAQDPSLALALAEDPAAELMREAQGVTESKAMIDGREFPAVTVRLSDKDVTLMLDPATHLVRRAVIDEGRGLRQRGANVKLAQVVIDYTQIVADGPVTEEQLAFSPPATAQEMEETPGDAVALVGKPAPHFRLSGLNGEDISDADLRGGVYVLCFWATWSGQSMTELAGLDDLQRQVKDDGVKCLAIDQHERETVVRQAIGRLGLSFPVLLDVDGRADAAYGAAAVPETVVVGRNGAVQNVFVGPGHGQEIASAVGEALKGLIVTTRPGP